MLDRLAGDRTDGRSVVCIMLSLYTRKVAEGIAEGFYETSDFILPDSLVENDRSEWKVAA